MVNGYREDVKEGSTSGNFINRSENGLSDSSQTLSGWSFVVTYSHLLSRVDNL